MLNDIVHNKQRVYKSGSGIGREKKRWRERKELERKREREGERSSRMSFVHEHHSLTWIVMPLYSPEQLEWLLCAF